MVFQCVKFAEVLFQLHPDAICSQKNQNIFREDLEWESIERGIDSNVENWSKSERSVLKSDWRLNQFYLVHIEARIWPIPLTKTDRNDTLWLWMATWHCHQTKRTFRNQWKIRKNGFPRRFALFTSISMTVYWAGNCFFSSMQRLHFL